MYAEIIPVLQCPLCGARPLMLVDALEENDEIIAGALRCPRCKHQTTIRDSIWDTQPPQLLTPAQITNRMPIAARLYEPAWRWYALSLLSGRRFPLREELTLLQGLIQPRANQVYVDVACSAGLYARALAQFGASVIGIDHSWAMLKEAHRRARTQGLRISYVRASAQALPIADSIAAGVVMGGSLNELGDQIAALHEVRRVLQPRGRFFCMNLLAAESWWGKALQRLLKTGGIDFPMLERLNSWFTQTDHKRMAQWRWQVVVITLTGKDPHRNHPIA
jgi:ubiquinone/menaquinone biosynthesis C-methylase UbiE/uncharacterized protein YbaR (Trm112 family)